MMKVDDNPDLNYEYQSRWKNFLMAILEYPIIFWVILKKLIIGKKLKTNCLFVDGLCYTCRQIKENATNWRALDIIYNYDNSKNKDKENFLTRFWMGNVFNVKAVRNRLKLIKDKLRNSINDLVSEGKEVRTLSIACGSAQGLIDIISEFNKKGIFIKALLVDLDPTAIEYAKNLSLKAGVINQIKFINASAHDLEEVVGDFKPNIIEMVGFLEYRPKEKAINLIKRIYSILEPGGTFFTSNVKNNIERPFLDYVIDWPMVYRTPKEFNDVLVEGGFPLDECSIIYEPLKVHGVAICKR